MAHSLKVAAWISILIVVVIFLNVFAIQIYGEAEFWFASIKILTIVGLLLMSLIVDLGGSPTHDRIGFRYWDHPGAMKPFMSEGNLGRFWGFLYTLINAAFSCMYRSVTMSQISNSFQMAALRWSW